MTNIDIQAVVFDLDGLMFNTEAVFDRSGRELPQTTWQRDDRRNLLLQMMGRQT